MTPQEFIKKWKPQALTERPVKIAYQAGASDGATQQLSLGVGSERRSARQLVELSENGGVNL